MKMASFKKWKARFKYSWQRKKNKAEILRTHNKNGTDNTNAHGEFYENQRKAKTEIMKCMFNSRISQ